MSVRQAFIDYKFNRDLKVARRRFAKVVSSSPYNKLSKAERRSMIKELLRGIGYKKVRIIERKSLAG